MTYKDLYKKSKKIIKINQSEYGLYIASPNFDNYKYCWLRDGTFIAYSMDLSGNSDSSRKYYLGIINILEKKRSRMDKLFDIYERTGVIDNKYILPARYTLNGKDTKTDWPEFQIDGYGIWLWGLVKHLEATKACNKIEGVFKEIIDLVIKYLQYFWTVPNYDCWEENGNVVNASTLACVYGGINSLLRYRKNKNLADICKEIKTYFIKNFVKENHIIKNSKMDCVDSSLLWASVPFNMFKTNQDLIINTVNIIEKQLMGTGLKRYISDEYYGGGEWPLLTASMGWYYLESKDYRKAKIFLKKVLNAADRNYFLPEQIPNNLNFPKNYKYWRDTWGDIAKPLLWSHAMYIILYKLLEPKDK